MAGEFDFKARYAPSDRILVTGGSGFIGTNLVAAYRGAGLEVVNVDQASPRRTADAAVWKCTDLTSADEVSAAVLGFQPTHVFHLGARTDLDSDDVVDYAANTVGVQNVLDAVRELDVAVRRLVVASSRLVTRIGYRPTSDLDYCPTTAYGESKVETERIVRAADDLPWVLVRPTSIWGPWFDVPYRDFFLTIAKGRYVHPRGRRIEKHFGYVGNTIRQLHRIMTVEEARVRGRTLYLADDPPIEVRDFANRISAALGTRPAPNVPLAVLRGLAAAGDLLEKAGRRAPLTTFRLENMLTPMYYDLAPTMALTDEPPIDLDVSVAATVEWMREQGLV